MVDLLFNLLQGPYGRWFVGGLVIGCGLLMGFPIRTRTRYR